MEIITLIENLVYKKGMVAEHGLSFLIDTGTTKILFDTGQSQAFLSNAELSGINIEEVDTVVISHGHYDHTGGLYAFLKKNKKAIVYIKKEAFEKKYRSKNSFIGTSYKSFEIKNRLKYIDKIVEIAEGVFIIPDIPVIDKIDTSFENFNIRKGTSYITDEFNDELYIAITQSDKLSVLSSCSHRGITNIIRSALSYFRLPVHLILGGFHLREASDEKYNHIVSYFKEIKPEHLGICHCTGISKFADLKKDLDMNVFYNMTGNKIHI